MPNKMLIDATHPEETRVVVVRGNRVEEFDFETAQRKQLRGNIYLAKVTRVEPSLQAAFIEYGGNRHGFLAFSEIHPDYYQIPTADRLALIEADEAAHREAEEENEKRSNRRRSRHRNSRRRDRGERVRSHVVEGAAVDPTLAEQPHVEFEGFVPARFDAPDHVVASETVTSEPVAVAETQIEQPADAAEAVIAEVHETVAIAAQDEPAEQTAVAASDEQTTDLHADEVTEHDEHAHDIHADGEHAAEGDDAEDDEDEDEDDEEESEEDQVESVGGDDVLEEVPERAFRPRRQYKIQEVIKRRQVMLVQVVKEERGNKGAALTTYLSLAGRYAVLMPNTARGGGISRKITSAQDRSRLKEVVSDLDVPEGMGIILRTAGASRSKPEIKRDFEYLIRMWETVRDMTLKSQAPTLVYEEGSLIKRSLRDLYNKEIEEIQVAGDAGYHEARDFMHMLMPSNTRAVKLYRDGQPLFSRMGVESQLDAMFTPTVQLRSGGYIVINQTEALVSIDVNSGRSTREHHIEDTALKTNLEAAEEVARQLRLRDLAGLIVIDFIDMDEKRNNRAVERKLSDCLRQDRARIQVGRISHFGLLEMSRQRIRASVLESSTEVCAHCGGTGHVRSVSSVALQLLRGVEEVLMKGATHNLVVRTRSDVALYVLNHKRGHLRDLEESFQVTIAVLADAHVTGQQSYVIDRGEQVHTLEAAKALLAAQLANLPPAPEEEPYDDEELFETEAEVETEETEGLGDEEGASEASGDSEGSDRKRRRRRRRRGRSGEAREGQDRETGDVQVSDTHVMTDGAIETAGETIGDEAEGDDDEADDQPREARDEQSADGERRPRRRGRRGGRRRRGGERQEGNEEGLAGSIADELTGPQESEASEAVADLDGRNNGSHGDQPGHEAQPVEAPKTDHDSVPMFAPAEPAPAAPVAATPEPALAQDDEKPARRRSTVREKVSFGTSAPAPVEPEAPAPVAIVEEPAPVAAPVAPPAPAPSTEAPRKAGWWSRAFGGGNS
ncbi:MAG: ribonuclease [Bradyrhizobiaceae bacterium PARB1]|nr:MAG: ribonuclease [Bradyrhizobiaceae bacterium PARB1]